MTTNLQQRFEKEFGEMSGNNIRGTVRTERVLAFIKAELESLANDMQKAGLNRAAAIIRTRANEI